METLLKLIIVGLLMVLGFIVSLVVMIFGWGLHPASWGWIIGGVIAQWFFMIILSLISHSKT